MSDKNGFLDELKRRNVVRVGVVYLIVAWLLAQVADLMLENFGAPDWVIQAILVVLIIGFPLALVFAWAFELTPEGIRKEKDVDRTESITHVTRRKLDRAIIAVLVIALAYFIWESRLSPSKGSESILPSPTGETASAGEEELTLTPAGEEASTKSVAVLPFVNMSSDPEQEYFSDGISEEILNSLAKVKDLKVAGRTSSFAFKGENQDLRRIGETLGVDHILEGSVRKSGSKVRITAQLIQVADGFHLWSESYDRELTDVFAIQDEIATAILEQLKAHLLAGVAAPAAVASERTNSESYDLYLLARQRLYERRQLSIESAVELLDRAVTLDPGYAPAHAQRGIAAILLSERHYGKAPHEGALAQAKLYLDKALELGPVVAEAWAGLGLYHENRPGEHSQAIEYLEKALAINPNLIDASNWLQNAYFDAGRQADAIRILEDMVERDPLYPPAIGNSLNAFAARGMYDRAHAVLDRARPYLPGDPIIQRGEAGLHFSRGEYAQGLPLAEAALAQQPGNAVYRTTLSIGLLNTHQNERLAAEGAPFLQYIGLKRLGRTEEAGMVARQLLAQGDVPTWFYFLNITGQPRAIVALLEERWPELDEFAAAYPANSLFGYEVMIDVAYAYQTAGDAARFGDALAHARRVFEYHAALGADNPWYFANGAALNALAGDTERAIDYVERAVQRGFSTSWRIADEWPYLKPLEGDPRYEAAQRRMREHVNTERAALGLKPVST
jgi:TolB-like protein